MSLHCYLKADQAKQLSIEIRKQQERPSMQPHESTGIVRGLLQLQNINQAWRVLNDELPIPSKSSLSSVESRDIPTAYMGTHCVIMK